MAKNKLKKSSQLKLIQLICNLIYEIRITPQKKKKAKQIMKLKT